MRSNAERFLLKLKHEHSLRKKVAELFFAGNKEAIVKLAAKNACPLTFDELVKAVKQHQHELSDQELETIAAGKNQGGDNRRGPF